MVNHGRACAGCKGRGKGDCVLKDWLKTRKGVKEEDVEDRAEEALEDVKQEMVLKEEEEVKHEDEEVKKPRSSARRSVRVKREDDMS